MTKTMHLKVKRAACAVVLALGAILGAMSGTSQAGDLVYTPINPSFGGSPLNSAHLQSLATAQRTATAGRSAATDGLGGSTGGGSTDADLFVRQLQSRLLSALASQVTDAIFGENPQDSGTVRFGDTTVTFERTLDSIRLVIEDPNGITEIVVPQLVSSTGLSPALTTGTLSGGLGAGLN
ncbi:curli assembly protein CsgF [Zavarzinia sp. CC-PAN008]|uniref:curli assembly protein CsgF n=1 Tax=Zavarzinia sp. CC-PAN008 TaxID=3243332 RepID=UPI003F745BCB